MTTTPQRTGRSCSLVLLSVTVIFIVCMVIIGVCVRFLVHGKTQQVILIVLICVLCVVGMTSVTILEIRRRRRINREKRVTKNGNYNLAPTAPPASNVSSWDYRKNYSARTTVQA